MAFWQQVRRGVTKAAAEAEKQANIARLTLEINGVKGNIRRKVEELGDRALTFIRQGEIVEPSLGTIAHEIAELEARVAEIEKQIEEVRSTPTGES